MTELLTASQMRAVEQAAIDSGEVTALELMERAGRGVVEAVFKEWPELHEGSCRAVVLCGPGNNGGDGFVVARLLEEMGWAVEAFLFGAPEKLPPDAKTNCQRWNGRLSKLQPNAGFDPWSVDLIVDAVFGTGLTRGLSWDVAFGTFLPEWDLRDVSGRPRVVAVDLPSGLCSDSGKSLDGDSLWADMTVTFHAPKPGLFLETGPFLCGRIVVADIGLKENSGPDVLEALPQSCQRDRVRLCGAPQRPGKSDPFGRATHKYTHGHALILSGPPSDGGAARLAARGALRVGAGLVTLGCPLRAQAENAAHLNAIMLRPIDGPPGLTEMLEDKRFSAVGLGPGLGLGKVTHDFVTAALNANIPTVLDAVALSRYERHPDVLLDLLHAKVVLTPHGGEFRRLFPDIAEKLAAPATAGPAYSKVDATREAAARAGCVVLFKGADTVIAAPDGTCSINSAHYDRAAPWLATAGSGDVLAGFITGLLARGFEPMQAAETAAWLHVETALEFGPGLISEDLPEMLPKVFSKLLA